MKQPPEVILIHETKLDSVVKDGTTFAMFVALIMIGVILDSAAMQWVGALIGFIVIVGRGARIAKDNRFTVDAARKRLDQIEAGETK